MRGDPGREAAMAEARTSPHLSPRRVLPWLMTALAVAFFLAEAWPLRPALDDAFISFR